MTQSSSTLLNDIAESLAHVFDIVCAAVIVADRQSPVYCAGDREVGWQLNRFVGVQATLADGLERTVDLQQSTTMGEAAFIGVSALRTLPDEPATVIAFATRCWEDLDRAMVLVRALALEVDNELALLRYAPTLAEVLSRVECGVTIADPNLEDSPLVYVNDAFTRMTGYTRAETL